MDDGLYAPTSPFSSHYTDADIQLPPHAQHQGYRGSVSTPILPPQPPLLQHMPRRQNTNNDAMHDPEYFPDPAQNAGNGTSASTKDIVIKNHFPVARIKRIMQADDDVGKVAQVTPVVVSKALELFMISLVTKAAAEAKARNSKRVGALHLKQAITSNEQFDFLNDIVSKVADAPEKSEDAADTDGKKKKAASRKKKKNDDDDDF